MIRPLRRFGPAVALGVAHLFGARAASADVHVEREDGAEACPDPASFAARAQDGATMDRSRDVTVTFARSKAGYASSIRTSDGMLRSLEDPTCDALGEAALVVVRLALAPGPATDDPSPPKPAEPPPEPNRASSATPAATSPVAIEARAGGALAFGLGSPFAPGARIGASLVFADRRWSVGATGLLLAPADRSVAAGTVTIDLLGGGLEGCRRVGSERLGADLCARAEIFRLAGAAQGFATSESHARPLATAGLVARGRARLAGAVGLFVEIGAAAPIIRERFEIQGAGLVYDPPVVAGTGAAGAVVDFE